MSAEDNRPSQEGLTSARLRILDFLQKALGSRAKVVSRRVKQCAFRKITLVSDVKDQLVKASLDVGRLGKKPLHQC